MSPIRERTFAACREFQLKSVYVLQLLLLIVTAGAWAAEPWPERMLRANTLARERRPDAKALYQELIATAGSPAHRAEALNNFGALMYEDGAFSAAEPLYCEAIASYRKANPIPPQGLAAALSNLAVLFRSQAKYAEAEGLFQEATALHDSSLARNNLAELYRSMSRYIEAEAMATQALVSAPGSAARAAALHTLAAVHHSQRRTSEAAELYEQAFDIRLKILGAAHPQTASTLGNLMLLRLQQREFAKAEITGLDVLKKYEVALGLNHPHVAVALTNLAQIYHSQNRLGDAEPYYRRAIAIWENAVGPEHPDTARGLKKLADFFADQGKQKGAVALYERAWRIMKRNFGPSSEQASDVARSLADTYDAQGRVTEAALIRRRLPTSSSR